MFITVSELNTHLYGETVQEITRWPVPPVDEDDPELEEQPVDDNIIAKKAIRAAEAEVKSYLSRFDTVGLFGAAGDARDEHLLWLVKDVAAWHLVCLANPNVEMALREKRYDDAIDYLMRVQSGKVVPGWDAKPDDSTTTGTVEVIRTGSNERRSNYY